MKNKKSVGIAVFGFIYAFLSTVSFLCFFITAVLPTIGNVTWFDPITGESNIEVIFIGIISFLILGFLFAIVSILLFRSNRWGYRIPLFVLPILALFGMWILIPLIMVHIYYFTRPKVKEEFKEHTSH